MNPLQPLNGDEAAQAIRFASQVDECPCCNDAAVWMGDPALSFCDQHYRQYLLTFQVSPMDLAAYRAEQISKVGGDA